MKNTIPLVTYGRQHSICNEYNNIKSTVLPAKKWHQNDHSSCYNGPAAFLGDFIRTHKSPFALYSGPRWYKVPSCPCATWAEPTAGPATAPVVSTCSRTRWTPVGRRKKRKEWRMHWPRSDTGRSTPRKRSATWVLEIKKWAFDIPRVALYSFVLRFVPSPAKWNTKWWPILCFLTLQFFSHGPTGAVWAVTQV